MMMMVLICQHQQIYFNYYESNYERIQKKEILSKDMMKVKRKVHYQDEIHFP